MNKTIYIIANGKGGVGKTLVSLIVYERLLCAKRPHVLLEIDSRKRLSSQVGENNVNSLPTPSMEEIAEDPTVVMNAWTGVGDALELMATEPGGAIVIDLGANMDGPFFEFARMADLGQVATDLGYEVLVLSPATSETEACSGALIALTIAGKIFPDAKRVFVKNRRDPGEFPLEQIDGCQAMDMPRCGSKAWSMIQSKRVRISDFLTFQSSELSKWGFNMAMGNVAKREVGTWYKSMMHSLDQFDLASVVKTNKATT